MAISNVAATKGGNHANADIEVVINDIDATSGQQQSAVIDTEGYDEAVFTWKGDVPATNSVAISLLAADTAAGPFNLMPVGELIVVPVLTQSRTAGFTKVLGKYLQINFAFASNPTWTGAESASLHILLKKRHTHMRGRG